MPTAIRRQSAVCVVAIAMLAAPMAAAQPYSDSAGLAPEVVQGFALLAKFDSNGLGAEATQVESWHGGRARIQLCRSAAGGSLRDTAGMSIAISGRLAQAIDRLSQYFSLQAIGPDAHTRLREALLSEGGVASVRQLFEAAIMSQTIALHT